MAATHDKTAAARHGARQWRIDLKWVTGIPFTLILALTILVFSLFRITGSDNAIDSLKAMNAPILADAQLQQEINARAPALGAFLNNPDFAQTVYNDPATLDGLIDTIPDASAIAPEGVVDAGGAADSESGEDGSQNGFKSTISFYKAPLKVFSSGTNETFGAALTVSLILLLLTGIPFILLSRRAGRFLSPGISLAVATWGPLLFLGAIRGSIDAKIDATQLAAASKQERLLMDVIRPLSDGVFGQAAATYRIFAMTGGVFMLAAALYFVLRKLLERRAEPVQSKPPAIV